MRASVVFIFAFVLLMFFDTLCSASLKVSYSVSVFRVVTLLSFNTSDPILLKDSGSFFIFLVCYYNETDNLSRLAAQREQLSLQLICFTFLVLLFYLKYT